MNNVLYKKTWTSGITQMHVKPPPVPLIKSNHDNKSEKYFSKLKFCRDLTSSLEDLYELNMAWFDNGELEELLLSVKTSI